MDPERISRWLIDFVLELMVAMVLTIMLIVIFCFWFLIRLFVQVVQMAQFAWVFVFVILY